MKIGLLSDTHGYFDEKLKSFFMSCDEIWHAGDIGTTVLLEELKNFKPLIAVYGNIDNHEIRSEIPKNQRHNRNGVDILMTHIGGYPGKY